MPAFKGSDFEIQLPDEFSDESTYAFAFRARSNFRPSVAVKTERLAEPLELATYVAQQLERIRSLLQDVSVVSSGPEKHEGLTAYGSVYDWGEATRRVRQRQHYILLNEPLRVVTLTGTGLRESFAEAEALFNAIFHSFKPAKQ
jgi:hypothetical protein